MEFIKRNKTLITVILSLAIALCSVFIFSKQATDPENYKEIIQSIDDKKAAVASVTAGAAAASAALAMVPGDVTTPIANQIMQLSSYLMIVVCILILEKFLLTIIGYLSFKILIPIACILFLINAFIKKKYLKILAMKFIIFALAIFAIIPCSLKIGDMIFELNSTVIEQASEQVSETELQPYDENSSWWHNTIGKAKAKFSDASDFAKKKLNLFIDAIAVFIIAYCALPIIVVLTVLWLIKFLFGIKIPLEKIPRPKKSNTKQEA